MKGSSLITRPVMTQELLLSTHLGGAQVDDVSRPFPLWYSPAQLIPHTNSQPTVCSPISFQWEFPVSFLVLCTYMYSFGFVITYVQSRNCSVSMIWLCTFHHVNSYMYCIIVAIEAHIGKANITVSTSNLCTSSKAAQVLSDNVFRYLCASSSFNEPCTSISLLLCGTWDLGTYTTYVLHNIPLGMSLLLTSQVSRCRSPLFSPSLVKCCDIKQVKLLTNTVSSFSSVADSQLQTKESKL